ncbi:MAG: hypothetical protein GY854_22245 [Deltaproteobacteria bacterium]|nr:hypothetical protein [Deltaproteobacteria bacterium]
MMNCMLGRPCKTAYKLSIAIAALAVLSGTNCGNGDKGEDPIIGEWESTGPLCSGMLNEMHILENTVGAKRIEGTAGLSFKLPGKPGCFEETFHFEVKTKKRGWYYDMEMTADDKAEGFSLDFTMSCNMYNWTDLVCTGDGSFEQHEFQWLKISRDQ